MSVETRKIVIKLEDRHYRRGIADSTEALERHARAAGGAEKTLGKTNETIRDSQNRLQAAGDAAEEMGRKTEAAGKRADGVGGALQGIGTKAKAWIAGVAVGAVLALAAAFYKAFTGAADLQAQMVGVAKTTGLSSRAIAQLRDDLVGVSQATGIGTDKLTGYAETAGQLGIRGSRSILAFVEAAAKLEAVSDLDADRAANALAKISNAFKLPIEQADQLGSVMNELSNTTPATAGDIADGLTRIGGAGEAIGVTVDEAAALQATLVGAGIESERAGTAIRNAFVKVQVEAEKVAAVMGTTTAEWSERLEREGMGAIMALLETLGAMPQAARAATIEDIFGAESFLQVSTLAQGLDTLRANMETAGTAFAEGTSLDREFAVSLQSVTAQKDLLLNKLSTFVTGLGTRMLPAVGSAISALNEWSETTGELTRRHAALAERVGNTQEVDRLLQRYRALESEGLTPANDSTGEMRRLIDEINSRMPGFVSGYDSAGRAVGLYADKLSVALTRQQALNRAMEAAAFQKTVERFADASDERRRAQRRRDQAPDDLYRAPIPFRAGQIGAAIGDRLPWSDRNSARRRFESAGEDIPKQTAEMEDLAVAVGQYTDLTRTAAEVQRDLATRGLQLTADQARELTQTYRDLGLAQADAGPNPDADPAPTPSPTATADVPSAAETRRLENEAKRLADEAKATAERTADAQGLLVEARRKASTEQAIHENALSTERLAQARQEAEARIALLNTEDERRRTSFLVAEEYDRQEKALALESVRLRERAAHEAAAAERDRAKASAQRIENTAERGAVLAVLEEEWAQAGTAATRQAVEQREQIETAFQAKSLDRARDLSDAQIAEFQRVSEAVSGSFDAFADVFKTRSGPDPSDRLTLLSDGVAAELQAMLKETETLERAGVLSAKQAEARIEAARDAAQAALRAIVAELDRLGVPAEEAADVLEELIEVLGDPDLSWTEELVEGLYKAADVLDGITSTLDALGEGQTADRVSHIADTVGGVGNAVSSAMSGDIAGTIKGVAQAVKGVAGLVGSFAAAREAARLQQEAFEDGARAVRDHTAAMRDGAVGDDVTADQLSAYSQAAIDAARAQVQAAKDTFIGSQGFGEAQGSIRDLLRSLAVAGLDVQDLQQLYADALATDDLKERRRMLAEILDLTQGRFADLAGAVGTYGDSLAGARAQLEDDLQRSGRSAAEALDRFVDKLDGADLGPAVDAFLASLRDLEPGTDAYEDAIEAFYRRVQDGEITLPDNVSRADIETLVDSLSGIRGEGGASAADVDRTNATSRTTATFAQQDVTNGYLQGLLRTVRAWFDWARGGAPAASAQAASAQASGTQASGDAAQALKDALVTSQAEAAWNTAMRVQTEQVHANLAAIYAVLQAASAPPPTTRALEPRASGNTSISVGPITVSAAGDPEAIARKAADEVYRRMLRELDPNARVIYGRTA